MSSTRQLDSPVGRLQMVATAQGLEQIIFADHDDEDPRSTTGPAETPDAAADQVLTIAATQLKEYFAGQRQVFDIPLDLQGTEFQLAAWRALANIPFGEKRSYGQQAEAIGRPKAVRAVGAANKANPVPIVVPCHRVVGASGSLTGYGGGLAIKEYLLNHEHAQLHKT